MNIGEVVDLVKGYVQQETIGPLRGAGRWLAYGSAGAILLACAASMLVLGVLRLLQNEFSSTFDDRWMSLLPYVAGLAVCVVVIGIAVSRISKTTLHQD